AYTLEISYAQTVVTIASIAGGTTNEFSAPPSTNPSSFSSGVTRISAFNSSSTTSPTGLVSVARIAFNVVGAEGSSSALGIRVITLSDPSGHAIPSTTAGCTAIVAAAATATMTPTLTVTATPT